MNENDNKKKYLRLAFRIAGPILLAAGFGMGFVAAPLIGFSGFAFERDNFFMIPVLMICGFVGLASGMFLTAIGYSKTSTLNRNLVNFNNDNGVSLPLEEQYSGSKYCKACGEKNDSSEKYCSNCGNTLGSR